MDGMGGSVSFAVLGPLEVRRDGRLVDVGGRRLRALLTLLLLDAGRTVGTEALVAGVWDGRSPNGVGNALQALVSRLRAAVGRELVVGGPSGYRLAVPPGQVDLHVFTRMAREGRVALSEGDAARAAAILAQALGLWRGAPLTDLPGGGTEVARLEELRIAAVEDRIEAELALGRDAGLAAELSLLVAAHPLRERLRGQLMRALYASGRQVEALAAYEDARAAFADQLGADPSPALARLHLAILRRDPALPVRDGVVPPSDPVRLSHPGGVREGTAPHERRPPHRTPEGPAEGLAEPAPEPSRPAKGNLRARLTSFVGREEDVATAAELLAANRLVTLLGPGGAGKTRLAVESADAVSARMPDGVWLIELASLRDPAEVAQTALSALGLRDPGLMPARPGALHAYPAPDPAAALPARHAAGHGPDPGAGPPPGHAPGAAAGRAPDPRPVGEPAGEHMGEQAGELDATGRLVTALAARGMLLVLDNCEHVVEAAAVLADRVLAECPGVRILATSREPLGITGETLWPVRPLGLEHAVRLFADRAAAARPGYRAEEERAAVERVCRELDGMPLAIELAAARLRSLSAAQIADRLGDRFRLLTGGSRTAMPRHRTLRAVVEWSWDLLGQEERDLAARLAVFAGGATLEAAEAVGGELDVLGRLVDKCLVVFEGGRYRMLETIRAYAAERLAESGEERAVRLAYARFFVDLAETAEPYLRRAEQVEWLARLSAEHDNLSSALAWAIEAKETDLAVRLVGGLGWYWWLVGHRAEAAQRAAQVIKMAEGADPARLALAHAMYGITWIGGGAGNWDRGRESLEAAAEAARRVGREAPHPLVAMAPPVIARFLGHDSDAEPYLEELLDQPDPWLKAVAHMFRGHLHLNAGRAAEGEADIRIALELFRTVGDRWGVGNSLAALAEVGGMRGDVAASIPLMQEAIELVNEVGAVEDTPYMRTRMAMALSATGRREAAVAALDETQELCDSTGDVVGMAGVRHVRGDFARAEGDFDAARRHYLDALRLLGDWGGVPRQFEASIRSSLGMLTEQEGDLGSARRLHDEALSLAAETRDGPVLGQVVLGYAALAVQAGDHAMAAVLLGGAAAISGFFDVVGFDQVRITEAAKTALGAGEFSRCHERGRAMPREEVVALAAQTPM
ncbi:BTAD domain-containing putative transcriptional regulator [Microbispora sp. NPDC049125]|uniref:AfsR/SARP family transcriptional regulator n=1 Tax=Microbispora sp. NPDC049125 TaxID=3154929 RepID=UPI003467D787